MREYGFRTCVTPDAHNANAFGALEGFRGPVGVNLGVDHDLAFLGGLHHRTETCCSDRSWRCILFPTKICGTRDKDVLMTRTVFRPIRLIWTLESDTCIPRYTDFSRKRKSENNSAPPRITLGNERFMASHMMRVKKAPDEPIKAPTMVKSGWFKMKPSAHNAQPEYELSSVMTTGMSAPPIEAVMWRPCGACMDVPRHACVVKPSTWARGNTRTYCDEDGLQNKGVSLSVMGI